MSTDRPVLLVDGVCNLCNASVAFVIRHDPPPGRFRFAALQSPTGQTLLRRHALPTADFDTVVVVDGDRVLTRSDAVLRILAGLGFPWSLLAAVLQVVPRRLRDVAYAWIVRNRYRWFGRRDACLVPTADVRARFLD